MLRDVIVQLLKKHLKDLKHRFRVSSLSIFGSIADEKTFDAVIRNLEIVGEAAKRLPDEITEHMPGIEWKKMKDLRDFVAHEYFGIDVEIIWNVICNKIPQLQQVVQK